MKRSPPTRRKRGRRRSPENTTRGAACFIAQRFDLFDVASIQCVTRSCNARPRSSLPVAGAMPVRRAATGREAICAWITTAHAPVFDALNHHFKEIAIS
jgi:hypothetical protein